MRLIQRGPYTSLWNEMERFRTEMGQMFERLGTVTWPRLAVTYPPVNVWEDEDKVFVEAELPGMELEHLEIYVTEGNQLTIQGERPALEAKEGVWHRQERGFGKFSRVIALPATVNADKVEARFEHGVLCVTMPKTEKAKAKRIPVKAE